MEMRYDEFERVTRCVWMMMMMMMMTFFICYIVKMCLDVLTSDRTKDHVLEIRDEREVKSGGGDDDGIRKSRGLILLIAHGLHIQWKYR